MTPTQELRERLRRLINERIPNGGSADDTRFSDDDLNDLIQEASSIYGAASMGWMQKAGMIQEEMGDIEQMVTGQETYRMTSLKDRLAYALKMSEMYAERDAEQADAQTPGGAFIVSVEQPEVM